MEKTEILYETKFLKNFQFHQRKGKKKIEKVEERHSCFIICRNIVMEIGERKFTDRCGCHD